LKNKIENRVYNFFINSNDFNGIPLRQISEEFELDYKQSIDLIKSLVEDEIISIQSSTNPHIIGFKHYPIISQLKILDDAKNNKVTIQKIGEITISSENTEFPICLYPSKKYLKTNRKLEEFDGKEYTKQLALGEPHLKPVFFEIEVLDRYFNEPRFEFKFEDYSGQISCKYNEDGNPILRKEDQIFLKTFGLGFDSDGNRLAVVYLRYLKDLTKEHQVFWKNKEVSGNCKILKEYHENTILGNWTFSYSIFSGFVGELKSLNTLSKAIFDKPLFRKDFDKENRPKEFTFFFTPTLKNYYEFVSILDKMISENINKDFFNGKVELFEFEELKKGVVERKQKGTLRLFEEWLISIYKIDNKELLKDLFKPFRKVRKERQNPAHKISENVYDKKFIEKQKKLITDSYSSVRALRKIFQQHPKAKDIEIPDWLDNGEIKVF
jgi:hypothetical protein